MPAEVKAELKSCHSFHFAVLRFQALPGGKLLFDRHSRVRHYQDMPEGSEGHPVALLEGRHGHGVLLVVEIGGERNEVPP